MLKISAEAKDMAARLSPPSLNLKPKLKKPQPYTPDASSKHQALESNTQFVTDNSFAPVGGLY
jgi:hypothetical protein